MFLRYKLRLIMLVVGLFIASCVKSCDEVRYAMFGKITTATRATITDYTDHSTIDYDYSEGGRAHKGSEGVERGWNPTGPIEIQYIANSDYDSRLAGRPQWGWMIPPFVFLGLLSFASWKFWKFYKS